MTPEERIQKLEIELQEIKNTLNKFDFQSMTAHYKTHRFYGNIGFYGANPQDQKTTPGNTAFNSVSGTGDDAGVNNNFAEVRTRLSNLHDILKDYGLLK